MISHSIVHPPERSLSKNSNHGNHFLPYRSPLKMLHSNVSKNGNNGSEHIVQHYQRSPPE